MSNAFNLPRNPADFRPPSPLGEDGANRFAEAEPVEPTVTSGDDPYRAPAASEGPVYKVTGYEATLPHRGGLILTFGWLGLGVPVAGLLLLSVFTLLTSIDKAIPYSPVLILSLIFSLPAWIMSSLDMQALEAGAMPPEGKRKTLIGGWLGVAGTFLALFLGLPAIVIAVYWIFLEAASAS